MNNLPDQIEEEILHMLDGRLIEVPKRIIDIWNSEWLWQFDVENVPAVNWQVEGF